MKRWKGDKKRYKYRLISIIEKAKLIVLVGNVFRMHCVLHRNAISSGPLNLAHKDFAQIEHFLYNCNLIFSFLSVSFLFIGISESPDAGITLILREIIAKGVYEDDFVIGT